MIESTGRQSDTVSHQSQEKSHSEKMGKSRIRYVVQYSTIGTEKLTLSDPSVLYTKHGPVDRCGNATRKQNQCESEWHWHRCMGNSEIWQQNVVFVQAKCCSLPCEGNAVVSVKSGQKYGSMCTTRGQTLSKKAVKACAKMPKSNVITPSQRSAAGEGRAYVHRALEAVLAKKK